MSGPVFAIDIDGKFVDYSWRGWGVTVDPSTLPLGWLVDYQSDGADLTRGWHSIAIPDGRGNGLPMPSGDGSFGAGLTGTLVTNSVMPYVSPVAGSAYGVQYLTDYLSLSPFGPANTDAGLSGADPTAIQSILIDEDYVVSDRLSGSDAPDLRYDLVEGPSQGDLTIAVDGTYTYIPLDAFDALNDGESQSLRFVYSVSDGQSTTKIDATLVATGRSDANVPLEVKALLSGRAWNTSRVRGVGFLTTSRHWTTCCPNLPRL